MSFDVSSMFTNIPVEKSIDITYEILVKSGVDLDTVDEFEKLAHASLDKNICQFDDKTFEFPGGVPMGGPMLSSIIAEVFMDRLERRTLNRYSRFGHAILWCRYVDDVFCIWRGTDEELGKFRRLLHSFDDNITFTVEVGGHRINYLDLTIELCHDELDDGMLTPTFLIYRKETFSGLSIHQDSWYPTNQKFAVVRALVNRVVSLPLAPDTEEVETKLIERIAAVHGLRSNVRRFIKNETRSSPHFPEFCNKNFSRVIGRPPALSLREKPGFAFLI